MPPAKSVTLDLTPEEWEDVLAKLPDRQGQAIYLIGALGCSYREAARRMGITLSSLQGLVKGAQAHMEARKQA